MKKIIFSFSFIMAYSISIAQTNASEQDTMQKIKKPQGTSESKKTDKPSREKNDKGTRKDAGMLVIPDSTQKATPKDKTGKDSMKVGDSPKFRR